MAKKTDVNGTGSTEEREDDNRLIKKRECRHGKQTHIAGQRKVISGSFTRQQRRAGG